MLCAVLSHSVVSDSATPWTVACQAPLSMGILQERILEWVAMPSSTGSSNPGIKPRSPSLHAGFLPGNTKYEMDKCRYMSSSPINIGPPKILAKILAS